MIRYKVVLTESSYVEGTRLTQMLYSKANFLTVVNLYLIQYMYI